MSLHVWTAIGQWPGVVALASLVVVGIRMEWAHMPSPTRAMSDLLAMIASWMGAVGYTVFMWVIFATLFHWAL